MAKYFTTSFKFHLRALENWKLQCADLVHLTKSPHSDGADMGNRPLFAGRPCVNGRPGGGMFLTCGGHVKTNNRPVRLVWCKRTTGDERIPTNAQ